MSGASSSGRVRKNAAGLGDVRGQRAAALALEQREVLGRERAEQRLLVGQVVELRHAVVLQVLADRQVLAHLDPERLEVLRRPDAREHQQHRRLVGAGGEDHLALGAQLLDPAVARRPRRRRRACRRRGSACASAPVITSRFGRSRAGCRNASAVAQRSPSRCVSWKRPTPSWRAPLKSGLRSWPACTAASIIVSTSGCIERLSETLSGPPTPWNASSPRSLSSRALEVRQHLVVAPALGAARGPAVVVGAVAADVDHRVDRARSADHLVRAAGRAAGRRGRAPARRGGPSRCST